MSLGNNLQFLRKMHKGMTQEDLAEKIGVSRQTISKWEMDVAFPEIDKLITLSEIFSCTLDELVKEDLDSYCEAYTNIRIEEHEQFRFVEHIVISTEPEDDAKRYIFNWAKANGITNPKVIGWDFPFLSQEQINVFHIHGYSSACILPEEFEITCKEINIIQKEKCNYAVITIKDPFKAPFALIPNAYKTLMRYMEVNELKHTGKEDILPCFEYEYEKDNVEYMDVYIAFDSEE